MKVVNCTYPGIKKNPLVRSYFRVEFEVEWVENSKLLIQQDKWTIAEADDSYQ